MEIVMNQRAGKTHSAALVDNDKVTLQALINFCKEAKNDLLSQGEEDSSLRFEILEEWLRNDFKGSLKYQSKMIGI
jgi:hypothetical protein